MTQEIQVDFTRELGIVKPMHAINNLPCLPFDAHENNLFLKLQQAGVPYARLHDTGGKFGGAHYVDVENIFPDFDADETDPASYDFAFTDRLLEEMAKYHIKPFYRLGATIENQHFIKAYHIYPPKDFAKWARICQGIIRHYNEGWANGYHFGIEYWEIWNEPENSPIPEENPMWKGTPEQFYSLYETASKHLKAAFPSIKVGGYGSCGFYGIDKDNVFTQALSSPRVESFLTFMDGFLEHCRCTGSPLDFFSWHSYGDVEDNLRYAAYAKERLTQYGYGEAEVLLNEWNPDIKEKGRLRDAANIAACMCAMQKTSTDMCMYYDGQITSTYCGLFDFTAHDVYKAYYAFAAFDQLYQMGREAFSHTDAQGVELCATKGEGRRGLLAVNRRPEPVRLSLSVKGASPQPLSCRAIDQDHDFTPVSLPCSGELELPSNGVWYLEFAPEQRP